MHSNLPARNAVLPLVPAILPNYVLEAVVLALPMRCRLLARNVVLPLVPAILPNYVLEAVVLALPMRCRLPARNVALLLVLAILPNYVLEAVLLALLMCKTALISTSAEPFSTYAGIQISFSLHSVTVTNLAEGVPLVT
jgi:hypothetical protein